MLKSTFSLIPVLVASCIAVPAAAGNQAANFDLAAEAVVSADTCEAMGFGVDRQGIAVLAVNVQQIAVWNGLTERQAAAKMRTAVASEFAQRDAEFARAKIMEHAPDNVDRFERRWIKRCERLAGEALTAPYFVGS